jgi:hypothetical protein
MEGPGSGSDSSSGFSAILHMSAFHQLSPKYSAKGESSSMMPDIPPWTSPVKEGSVVTEATPSPTTKLVQCRSKQF